MSIELEKTTENKALENTALKMLVWPTSQPGPQATQPPQGQKPMPTRTDQVTEVGYDQEHGKPAMES